MIIFGGCGASRRTATSHSFLKFSSLSVSEELQKERAQKTVNFVNSLLLRRMDRHSRFSNTNLGEGWGSEFRSYYAMRIKHRQIIEGQIWAP